MEKKKIINEVLPLAKKMAYGAADIIMEVYKTNFSYEIKSDDSPVTIADKKSDEYIRKIIKENFPTHALLTEECEDDLKRLNSEYVWIIDPLDGTKNFISHDGEFAINIALVHEHTPILGLVMIPVTGELYYAIKDEGAYYLKSKESVEERIYVSDKLSDLVLLTSVFHQNEDEIELAKRYNHLIKEEKRVGSAIKACMIAKGLAEVSFRFNSNTKEWDTCAPQIVVEEAGGFFTEPDGTPIAYNRKDVYNRNGFSIYNRKENNFSKDYIK